MLSARTNAPAALWARRAALVVGGSAVLALAAQVAVPFWPVPVTMQTLAIPVLVAVLGRELGTAAVVAYLLEGLAGLPVFSGFLGGPGRFVGPLATTAGYLLGFPLVAWLTGTLYRTRLGRSYAGRVLAIFLATAVDFVTGAGWLAAFFVHDAVRAIALGVTPFLLGDVAKCVVAAAVRPRTT